MIEESLNNSGEKIHADVEMTITSCKRLDYFIRTIDSILQNMEDIYLLNKITCCDDNSSQHDRDIMVEKFPEINFIWSDQLGHPYSLIKLFGQAKSEFILHWEDDFVLKDKGKIITKCLNILQDKEISSVILTKNHGIRRRNGNDEYFVKMYDKRVAAACPSNAAGFNRFIGQPANPGFSLNPGMHRRSAIQSVPWPICKQHEYNFAFNYHKAGYKVAYLDKFYVEHIGEISSFDLNKTGR